MRTEVKDLVSNPIQSNPVYSAELFLCRCLLGPQSEEIGDGDWSESQNGEHQVDDPPLSDPLNNRAADDRTDGETDGPGGEHYAVPFRSPPQRHEVGLHHQTQGVYAASADPLNAATYQLRSDAPCRAADYRADSEHDDGES